MPQIRGYTGPVVASRITELLDRLRDGDRSVRDDLIELVYGELHHIAQGHLRKERPDHTLSPTALVHEAYLKLFEDSQPQFANRAHFLAVASRVMRRILVDYARAREAAKRGGDGLRVPWDTNMALAADAGKSEQMKLLELDGALEALAQENPSLAELIEMRYFGGMTAEESAKVVGRSVHIVRHEIRLAQAWLRRELARET